MRKTIVLTVLILSLSFLFFSFTNISNNPTTVPVPTSEIVKDSTDVTEEAAASSMFSTMHLDEAGLSQEAFDFAVKGYNKLIQEGRVGREKYLTIVDFSQNSRKKRFYIIDMEKGELAWNTFVAHGKNSGL